METNKVTGHRRSTQPDKTEDQVRLRERPESGGAIVILVASPLPARSQLMTRWLNKEMEPPVDAHHRLIWLLIVVFLVVNGTVGVTSRPWWP
jgi:hypothetical protein